MTGDEAFAAARAKGLVESPGTDRFQYLDTSDYDDCAGLSAITLSLSGHAFAGVEMQLFHHGQPVGPATDEEYAAPSLERLSDDSIQVTYYFPKEGEAYAYASGTAVSTFTWDPETESVVHSGEFPPGYGRSAASPAPSSAKAAAPATGADWIDPAWGYAMVIHRDDVGFCFAGEEALTCFGKEANQATLPASGDPTSETDLPATGWEEGPEPIALAPGESTTLGPFTCTATAGGFDCSNDETGAAISVAGAKMRLTPARG